jgi:hypothetical protein
MSKVVFNSFEDLGKHLNPKAVFEKEIRDFFSEKGIESVWHFTDRSNLKSIEKYGLQSLFNIEQKEIPVELFGADRLSHSLDHSKKLDQFVHLSFIDDHPMYHVALGRKNIVDPVWIEIDLSIIFNENTFFSSMVANASNAPIFKLEDIQKYINFDKMFDDDFETMKNARKAEILIHDSISPDKIIKVHDGRKTYFPFSW